MIGPQSFVLKTTIRAATPLAIIVGIYLLFAGHNNPGGGFAAGLVFGAVLTLRTVAGMQRPGNAQVVVAVGLLIVIAASAAPMVWGDAFLDQAVVSAKVSVLGKIKSGTALPFDIGVTFIVVGVVMSLLGSLRVNDNTAVPAPAPSASGQNQ